MYFKNFGRQKLCNLVLLKWLALKNIFLFSFGKKATLVFGTHSGSIVATKKSYNWQGMLSQSAFPPELAHIWQQTTEDCLNGTQTTSEWLPFTAGHIHERGVNHDQLSVTFGGSWPEREGGQLALLPASVLQTSSASASLTLDCTSSSGISLALHVSIWSLMLLYFFSRTCSEESELEKPAKDSAFESKWRHWSLFFKIQIKEDC